MVFFWYVVHDFWEKLNTHIHGSGLDIKCMNFSSLLTLFALNISFQLLSVIALISFFSTDQE